MATDPLTDVDLAAAPLPADEVGLLAGLVTTRAVRHYRPEPVPEAALRAMLFAATRAPSGSNRQPFRFVVLRDGPVAGRVKAVIGESARRMWAAKRAADGYDAGSGTLGDSPKARMARSMQRYVDEFETVPVLVLPCLAQRRHGHLVDGASVYPACQNLLLAARALGYGGVMTTWHLPVEAEVAELVALPEEATVVATITLGRPAGSPGPVRRLPLGELVAEERWGRAPAWAVDPPGTRFTAAGPPRHPDGPPGDDGGHGRMRDA